MSDPQIATDERGYPVLTGNRRDKPRRECTSISLGVESYPLYDEHGRPLSPTESLHDLLSDGPINESQYVRLADEFDDPETLHAAARRLGVIRKRQDGSVLVMLPGPEQEPATQTQPQTEQVNLADSGHEEGPIVNTEPLADRLTPMREAQRLLGQPVIGSGLEIVRHGRERFVRTSDLERKIAAAGRGGKAPGAGERVATAISDAQARRAATNREGQANDTRGSRSRRYGRASELSSDS
jgi:hypothetical protein